MRRLSVSLATALVVVGAAVGTASAKHGGVSCVLNTQMSAKNETTGSTSTATGHTQVKVWKDGSITFKTQIFNPNHETFIAGHVHTGTVGVAGAIVVPLFSGSTTSDHVKLGGTATPTGTTGAAICQNPSGFYVNYHTTAFTAGAIRGQL